MQPSPDTTVDGSRRVRRQGSVVMTDRITTNDLSDDDYSHDDSRGHKRVMINQYFILEQIGKGKHGVVLKCYPNNEPHNLLAIKRVPRKTKETEMNRMMKKSNQQERFGRSAEPTAADAIHTYESNILREIATMKKCNHMHVVKLVEVINDRNNHNIYMIMEYLGGGEVKWQRCEWIEYRQGEEVRRRKVVSPVLKVSQSRRIIRDALLGLEYLHKNHIVHRDIKPSNLLYTENRTHVKIADFGVACALAVKDGVEDANNAYLAKRFGTVPFMAPELAWLEDRPDHLKVTKSIDIWALGVTLYCLLFGELPFPEPDDGQLSRFHKEMLVSKAICRNDWLCPEFMGVDRISTGGRHAPPDTAGGVIHLLDRCLDKDYRSRITIQGLKESLWLRDIMPPDDESSLDETPPAPISVTAQETNDAVKELKFSWGRFIPRFLRPLSSREKVLPMKEKVNVASQTRNTRRSKQTKSTSESSKRSNPTSSVPSMTTSIISEAKPGMGRRGSAATVDVPSSSQVSPTSSTGGGFRKYFQLRNRTKGRSAPPSQVAEATNRPLVTEGWITDQPDIHGNALLLCKSEEILSHATVPATYLSPRDISTDEMESAQGPRRTSSYHDTPGAGPSTAIDSDMDDIVPGARKVTNLKQLSVSVQVGTNTSREYNAYSDPGGSASAGSSLGQMLSAGAKERLFPPVEVRRAMAQSGSFDGYADDEGEGEGNTGHNDGILRTRDGEDDLYGDEFDEFDDDDASSVESGLVMKSKAKSTRPASAGEM